MKKGMKKLIFGLVLTSFSFVIPFIMIIPLILKSIGNNDLLRGNTEYEFIVEEEGNYTVWNHTSGLYEGESFNFSETLPNGIVFKLIEKASGAEIELKSDTSTTQSSNETVTMRSLLSADISKPGTYILRIDGNSDFDRIFSIKKSLFSSAIKALGAFAAVGVLCFLAFGGGAVLTILGIVQLAKKEEG